MARLWDLTDPTAPQPLGGLDLPGPISSVASLGRFAIVGAGSDEDPGTLLIVDLAAPMAPAIAAALPMRGYLFDVAVAGDHAVVAMDREGVAIVSLGDFAP